MTFPETSVHREKKENDNWEGSRGSSDSVHGHMHIHSVASYTYNAQVALLACV